MYSSTVHVCIYITRIEISFLRIQNAVLSENFFPPGETFMSTQIKIFNVQYGY